MGVPLVLVDIFLGHLAHPKCTTKKGGTNFYNARQVIFHSRN